MLDGARDRARRDPRAPGGGARRARARERPALPMILLRSPKGWTGLKELDGIQIEGTARAHQVPAMQAKHEPRHLAALEEWLRSYRPEELFDANGGADRGACSPPARPATLRMGANPHTVGGSVRKPLNLPDVEQARGRGRRAGQRAGERDERLGEYFADVFTVNADAKNFRIVCPDEVASNRLGAGLRGRGPRLRRGRWTRRSTPATRRDGRIMEVLSEHNCQGWMQGYVLTGRHGVFPCYEAFIPIVDGMVNQYAKFLKMSRDEAPWRAPVRGAELPADARSAGARTTTATRTRCRASSTPCSTARRTLRRIYLPADANTLLVTMDKCLRSTDVINLVIAVQAPAPAVADDRRGQGARRARRVGLGLGVQRRRRARTSCSPPAATIPTDRAAGRRGAAARRRCRSCGCASSTSTTSSRWPPRPHHPQRALAGGVHADLHQGPPGAVQLPRLPVGDPPADPPPPAAGALPRARLHRGGHDHHPVRPAGDERRRPLPARDRGADPRRHPRRRDAPRHVRRVRRSARSRTPRARSTRSAPSWSALRATIREIGDDPPEITDWVWSASNGRGTLPEAPGPVM